MGYSDHTDIGGTRESFLTTHWSLVEGVKRDEDKDSALIEFFQPFNRDRSATLKTRQFTYHCTADGRELLFDRLADPREVVNLSADTAYQAEIAALRKLMVARLQEASFSARFKTAEY